MYMERGLRMSFVVKNPNSIFLEGVYPWASFQMRLVGVDFGLCLSLGRNKIFTQATASNRGHVAQR